MTAFQSGLRKKRILNELIDWIVLFCIIWNSNSFFVSINSYFGVLLLIILIAIKFVFQRISIDAREVLFLFPLLIIPVLSLLINGATYAFGSVLRFCLTIFAAFLVAKSETIQSFSNKFIITISVLTIISLLFYSLINYFGFSSFLSKLPVLTNVNGATVFSAGIFNVYTYRFDRNMSIFWEPAIYCSYCAVAILLELAFMPKCRYFLVIICVLGMLSSKSTGGYIVLGLLIAFFIVRFLVKRVRSRAFNYIILFSLLIIAIFLIIDFENLVLMLNRINPSVFYKLEEQDNSSFSIRAASASYNLQLFLNKPLFGYGVGSVDNYYVIIGGHNQTSTLTYYLSALGMFGFAYLVILFIGIVRINLDISIKTFFALIFVFVLLKEPYYFSLGMHTIIFVMFLNRNAIRRIERRNGFFESFVFRR